MTSAACEDSRSRQEPRSLFAVGDSGVERQAMSVSGEACRKLGRLKEAGFVLTMHWEYL